MEPVISLKRPFFVDYKFFIFCHAPKSKTKLSTATEHGVTTVRNACKTRLCKTRLCETRLCKTRLCKTCLCKTRLCKTRLCKTRLCKTQAPKIFIPLIASKMHWMQTWRYLSYGIGHVMLILLTRVKLNVCDREELRQDNSVTEESDCSTEVAVGNRRSFRRGTQSVNWSLCIFCQSPNKNRRVTK